MRTIFILCVTLVGAAAPAAAARVAPEVQLDKALAGRVAGKPIHCIQLHEIQSSEIFDRSAILYKAGRTWYLNRPSSGLPFLERGDVLVTDTHSSALCNVDVVHLIDRSSHFPSGSVGLGDFIPYTLPKN